MVHATCTCITHLPIKTSFDDSTPPVHTNKDPVPITTGFDERPIPIKTSFDTSSIPLEQVIIKSFLKNIYTPSWNRVSDQLTMIKVIYTH